MRYVPGNVARPYVSIKGLQACCIFLQTAHAYDDTHVPPGACDVMPRTTRGASCMLAQITNPAHNDEDFHQRPA
jgi:hypothetical protein